MVDALVVFCTLGETSVFSTFFNSGCSKGVLGVFGVAWRVCRVLLTVRRLSLGAFRVLRERLAGPRLPGPTSRPCSRARVCRSPAARAPRTSGAARTSAEQAARRLGGSRPSDGSSRGWPATIFLIRDERFLSDDVVFPGMFPVFGHAPVAQVEPSQLNRASDG